MEIGGSNPVSTTGSQLHPFGTGLTDSLFERFGGNITSQVNRQEPLVSGRDAFHTGRLTSLRQFDLLGEAEGL